MNEEREQLHKPSKQFGQSLTLLWKKVTKFDYAAFAVITIKSLLGTLPVLRICLTFMLIFGLGYPLIITGIAQGLLPWQANGSLLYSRNNEVIGSALIGQKFTSPLYFHGRISAVGYNAAGSGSSNLAPSNPLLIERIQESLKEWKRQNPDVPDSSVPLDLVTSSASGLDPHISPEAAKVQIPRVSRATGISEQNLRGLVAKHVEEKEIGLFGERRVNVLELNLDVQSFRSPGF
jgi:potassium-transporting ATPase KdpC subunit